MIDLTGEKYGRLTVVEEAAKVGSARKRRAWMCKCECGSIIVVEQDSLRTGNTKSCGCLRNEKFALRKYKHGFQTGGVYRSEYRAWQSMKGRCSNEKYQGYHRYGGRGIRVCGEWANSFEAFYLHVGPKPSPEYSLDRIDPDGNYEPGNVRWADKKTQAKNVSKA